MRARQDADLDVDLPDFVESAAVRTNPILKYLLTKDVLA